MKNLTDPKWIQAKGWLFLFLGLLSGMLLFLEHPTLKAGVLLALTVWASCRFYYFAFYVTQHYVDPRYRFAGLWSLARYWMAAKPPKVDELRVCASVTIVPDAASTKFAAAFPDTSPRRRDSDPCE
jgi:hypothetical protein